MPENQKKAGKLSIHTENIFPIIKKWLYSEHDIFLRELISNAVDAISKRAVLDETFKKEDGKISIICDKDAKTIKVIDNGLGMSEAEVKKYINQIAFSGAEEFVDKYKDSQNGIIGHFGLGFYSTFMVAEQVAIDTLSYRDASTPAHWECEGETEYTLATGTYEEIGTCITISLNKDSENYLEASKIKELVEKYSNFIPIPLMFEDKQLNQTVALWNKKPKEVKDEEYIEFYKSMYHDHQDPLFWIHLNVDFPFALRGILYFPKITSQLDLNKGAVSLYCNNVFVAENLKEFIPEFLLMSRGGIDVPDIPLNVSRSFLQNDVQVKKISNYIIKKVGDHLQDIFKSDREKYNNLWKDIEQFIKYGMLTDEKFYDSVKDIILFRNVDNEYITLAEYKEKHPAAEKLHKIFYTSSEKTMGTYLEIMKNAKIEVIVADSPLDSHFLQHIEMKNMGEVSFIRIDSELNEHIINNKKTDDIKDDFSYEVEEDKTSTDADGKETVEKIKTVKDRRVDAFNELLENASISIEFKSLVKGDIPGMVVFNEHMRRFQEMNNLIQKGDDEMLGFHTFVVNAENNTVKKILALHKDGATDKAKLLAKHIHDLSLLEQKQFTGAKLQEMVERSREVLELLS